MADLIINKEKIFIRFKKFTNGSHLIITPNGTITWMQYDFDENGKEVYERFEIISKGIILI